MVKQQALKLAGEGYRVLIPDIYNGKVGVDKEEAAHLMGNLDWMKAKDDLVRCAAFLKAEGSPKVGATGFCMGGALSMVGAQHSPDVVCAAPFYGIAGAELCQPETLKKPIEGHFGTLDDHAGFSDPASAQALQAKLDQAGVGGKVWMYEGVGHGFLNPTPDSANVAEGVNVATGFPAANKDMQDLAWQRLFAFFEKHVKN